MGKELSEKRIKRITALSNLGEVGLWFLLWNAYPGIHGEKKIRYSDKGRFTYLDVFDNKDKGKKPLFIYIHGGGWVSGTRAARRFYCKHWVKRGYVAASVGYDYGAGVTHPTHLKQIFKAVEYLLDNADKYGIDREKVVIAGESAGGYFTSMIGAVATHRELYDEIGIDFKYRESFKPAACVIISGVFDPLKALDSGFPDIDLYTYAFTGCTPDELKKIKGTKEYGLLASAGYLDEQFPPSFVIGSDKDKLRPEAERAYSDLQKSNVKSSLFICSGINGVHAGALSCDKGRYGRACARETEKFLNEVLK